MQKYKYDVLGIGNAVTDIFVEVEESFLKKNNLVEGTMKLVDEVFIMELLKDLNISKTYAGGSVANTLSTISKLGGKCAFIGSRKNDKYGKLFSNSMEQEKIDLLNKENEEGKASSLCLVLVTPNGERTMCTYLGASTNLNNDNLELSSMTKSNIIYLEGYLFDFLQKKTADIWLRKFVIYTGFLFSERLVFDAIVKLYIDGVLSSINYGTPSGLLNVPGDVIFGRNQHNQGGVNDHGEFVGEFGPIRIFNHELTQSEVEFEYDMFALRYKPDSYSATPAGLSINASTGIIDVSNSSGGIYQVCLLYTSPSPRDRQKSRMPSYA